MGIKKALKTAYKRTFRRRGTSSSIQEQTASSATTRANENENALLAKGHPKSYGATHMSFDAPKDDSLRQYDERSSLIVSDGSPGKLVPSHHASIGMLGGIAICVNSLTGPAMLNLPAAYQRSGLIPTTACLIFVCMIAALSCLHMANVISKVPGNSNFQREVEFSDSFQIFWGRRWFVFTQITFFFCILCLSISSIVDTAQVVDMFVGHWGQMGSVGLAVRWGSPVIQFVWWNPSDCDEDEIQLGQCIPFEGGSFEDNFIVLSLGYVISAVLFIPMCLMDLKENADFQVAGFLVLLATSLQFIISFWYRGLDLDNVSLWGESWGTLFGVVLFNFSVVVAIPAWLYEKDPSVKVPTVIHVSSIMSTVLYILIGGFGALAIPNVSDNMLESMMSGAFGPLMQFGSSLFAFFIVGLGIPLFSVLVRMNLTGGDLCSHGVGNMLSVYLPWLVSWMLYRGGATTKLLSWGGILFTSVVAFILPLLLALHTLLEFDDFEGLIPVYGPWFKSLEARKRALYVLLLLSIGCVVVAIGGLLTEGREI